MAENIFDFRHVDVYCQYYSFKNDISYKSAKSLWNGKCIAVYADNAAGEKNQGRGKKLSGSSIIASWSEKIFGYISSVASGGKIWGYRSWHW